MFNTNVNNQGETETETETEEQRYSVQNREIEKCTLHTILTSCSV